MMKRFITNALLSDVYRVGIVVGYLVGLTLIWVFHQLECQNTKSTQPGIQPTTPPCTVSYNMDAMYVE